MRKRKTVEKNIDKICNHPASKGTTLAMQVLYLEVLLDIRELLQHIAKGNISSYEDLE